MELENKKSQQLVNSVIEHMLKTVVIEAQQDNSILITNVGTSEDYSAIAQNGDNYRPDTSSGIWVRLQYEFFSPDGATMWKNISYHPNKDILFSFSDDTNGILYKQFKA